MSTLASTHPFPILLVDDDKLVLAALTETLQREGYTVLTASNGEEALSILGRNPIALIICDQRMPGMNGIAVLECAKRLQPEAIRILLSANIDIDTVMQAINIGQASQYIMKPWDPAWLLQCVAASCERYHLGVENKRLQNSLQIQNENLQRELSLGAKIHETLLLGNVPKDLINPEIHATSIASKEIDGDFFEFYRGSLQTLDVVVGDVMGKGLPSALVGTAVKTHLLRFAVPFARGWTMTMHSSWTEDLLSPADIVSRVHTQIVEQLVRLEYFVSLFYARFQLTKQELTFVDCGAAKPIHYRAKKKKAFPLIGQNMPLGIHEENLYTQKSIAYDPGDLFILYSDGVTEAKSPNKELYGYQRLLQLVEENAQAEAKELLHLIKNSVTAFAQKENFDDDLTLIVIKIREQQPTFASPSYEAKFSASLTQLKAVRNFIQRFCRQIGKKGEACSQGLQLAINEAFCNIVKHGYKTKKEAQILIRGTFGDQGITLEIKDRGQPFDPSALAEPSLAGDQENGFGWYIIPKIIDEIEYTEKATAAGWNYLRLFKKFMPEEEPMQISHAMEDHVLVITPTIDSLDAKEAPEFKEKVIALIQDNDMKSVVFDLHNLEFIDSSGLGSFLSVLRVLHSSGGELKLACLNKPIRTMIELVCMHKIFEIFNSKDDAIRSFKSHG